MHSLVLFHHLYKTSAVATLNACWSMILRPSLHLARNQGWYRTVQGIMFHSWFLIQMIESQTQISRFCRSFSLSACRLWILKTAWCLSWYVTRKFSINRILWGKLSKDYCSPLAKAWALIGAKSTLLIFVAIGISDIAEKMTVSFLCI